MLILFQAKEKIKHRDVSQQRGIFLKAVFNIFRKARDDDRFVYLAYDMRIGIKFGETDILSRGWGTGRSAYFKTDMAFYRSPVDHMRFDFENKPVVLELDICSSVPGDSEANLSSRMERCLFPALTG